MSKLRAIAIAFSVILLVLFATLVYLMTTINPPEQDPGDVKPNDTAKAGDKFEDADYYLNLNEAVFSNENLRYGLEKVTGEYDVDAYGKIIAKLKPGPNYTEIPALSTKSETQENCTSILVQRIRKIELVTQPVEPAKGFRRSVNEKELLENEEDVHMSPLLKIKRLNEHPGIQIKLVSDNLKKIATMFNSSSKIIFETNSTNNSIRSASMAIAENGTLTLDIFANAIDLIGGNDTVSYKFDDDNTRNETNFDKLHKIDTPSSSTYYENNTTFITDSTHLNWLTETEITINNNDSSSMYTYNFMNNNFKKEFSANDDNKNTINTDGTLQETSKNIFREENETVSRTLENDSVSYLEMESTIITENVDTVFASDESNNSSNLVGLLIPESTANLTIE